MLSTEPKLPQTPVPMTCSQQQKGSIQERWKRAALHKRRFCYSVFDFHLLTYLLKKFFSSTLVQRSAEDESVILCRKNISACQKQISLF